MSYRRFALEAVCVVALIVLIVPPCRSSAPSNPASVSVPVPLPVPGYTSLPPPTSGDERTERWHASADLLAERCDVDTHTMCSGTACATVAWLPDLDSLQGWASLGWHNPGLFAVSVLGDIGLEPPGGWPCNDAISRFFSGVPMDVAIGDGPRGTWVVCAATSGDPATTAALCTSTAAGLGLPWTGTDPDRHL